MHDHEALLRHELHRADAVQPTYALPTILRGARRREAWLIVLVATVGALVILVGLVLLAREQPAPAPQTTSTRLWEA